MSIKKIMSILLLANCILGHYALAHTNNDSLEYVVRGEVASSIPPTQSEIDQVKIMVIEDAESQCAIGHLKQVTDFSISIQKAWIPNVCPPNDGSIRPPCGGGRSLYYFTKAEAKFLCS